MAQAVVDEAAVGVVGDAFVLFTAHMRDLTIYEHLFDASRRFYCLSSYVINSIFI